MDTMVSEAFATSITYKVKYHDKLVLTNGSCKVIAHLSSISVVLMETVLQNHVIETDGATWYWMSIIYWETMVEEPRAVQIIQV